jgi:hypothetical protein
MLRRWIAGAVIATLVLGFAAFLRFAEPAVAQGGSPGQPGGPPPGQPGGPPPGTPPGPGGPGQGMRPMNPMMVPDSFSAERDSMVKAELKEISGKEKVAAESVFKNIKVMNGLPAERMLRAMNGWGHALGVRCKYCHVVDHWKDDDKEQKKTARMMVGMVDTLNEMFLSRVKHPDGGQAHAGCFTCHRGHAKP